MVNAKNKNVDVYINLTLILSLSYRKTWDVPLPQNFQFRVVWDFWVLKQISRTAKKRVGNVFYKQQQHG